MIELWQPDHAALRWQADQWPGAISTSAGASALQRAMAKGQRGWKWQPEGGSSGEGISPATGANRCLRTSSRGTLASSARV